jgi:hypothetical protein
VTDAEAEHTSNEKRIVPPRATVPSTNNSLTKMPRQVSAPVVTGLAHERAMIPRHDIYIMQDNAINSVLGHPLRLNYILDSRVEESSLVQARFIAQLLDQHFPVAERVDQGLQIRVHVEEKEREASCVAHGRVSDYKNDIVNIGLVACSFVGLENRGVGSTVL